MSVYLEGIRGEYERRQIPISQNALTIGRGAGSQLLLRDTYVSRTHATIFHTQTGFAIRDENSRMGTLVNGKHIQSNLLRSGDVIEIGGNTFRFVESQPAQAQSNPRPQPNYPQNPQNVLPNISSSDPYASPKDRTTAVILAFFLGGIGAHKLYLGDKNAFILYLLFCWTGVPAILAIIDGVTYLGMSDEGFRMKYSGR